MLVEQLVQKQQILSAQVVEHEYVESKLNTLLLWCRGRFPKQDGAESGGPLNMFDTFGRSVLRPLWWRARVLQSVGKAADDATPLTKIQGEQCWEMWRDNFTSYERLPGQWNKTPKEMRSIFDLTVNKMVGSVALAKGIINFGVQDSNAIDKILSDIQNVKVSEAHRQHIQETHRPDEATGLVRQENKTATSRYFAAQRLAREPPGSLTSSQNQLVSAYLDGSLWTALAEARRKHQQCKPLASKLSGVIEPAV
jgi:hypothetical protein